MTVPPAVIVMEPEARSVVPAGTPVFAAPTVLGGAGELVLVGAGELVLVVAGELVLVVAGALVLVAPPGWNITSAQYCEDLQVELGNLLLEPYAYTPEFDEETAIAVVATVVPE